MIQPLVTNLTKSTPRRLRACWLVGIVGLMLAIGATRLAAQNSAPADAGESAAAQTSAPPKEPAVPPKSPPRIGSGAGRIQYVGPDTYILLDAEGQPQSVPGMTYEDFLAAWKQLQKIENADRRPRYTIESINIDGQANQDRAELRFDAAIHLLTDEPVAVPLGLVGAILHGEPRIGAPDDVATETGSDNRETGRSKPQDEYLSYDPENGGFIARLAGRVGERRAVSLNLVVPLARDGAQAILPLNCPRALSSNLTLSVDAPVTEVNVNNGTVLAREPTAQGGTRLAVAGAVGPFQLAWQTGENRSGELGTVLDAVGAIQVSIDGRSVRSDARLTVRSYGGSFDRFRVRLPPAAQLVRDRLADAGGQDPAYRVTLDQTPADGAAAESSQVVLVELPEKQQGPVVVELSTEQPIGPEDAGLAVNLAGFEVLGAVRQFGDVALDIADDWQVRWDSGANIRQVDPGELDASLQHPGLTAAFQYDRQPWSLGLNVDARQSRVHVTPKYELDCSLDEARLTVHLGYQMIGARAFEFRVGMNGWEMSGDPIESGGLVDQDRIYMATDDTLVLPLAQASSRRAAITFTLRRALPRDATRIELPLPVPQADSVGTGELLIRAAPDIDLLPDVANSIGLTPVPETEFPDADELANGNELHFRSLLPKAVLVAERVSRAREVSTQVETQIDVTLSEARIEQRIEYDVRYDAIKELAFSIPNELALDQDELEVALLYAASGLDERLDKRHTPLTVTPSADDDKSRALGGERQLRIALPQPRLGDFSLRIRYHARRPEDSSVGDVWELPLIQPDDGRRVSSRAIVRAPRTLSVRLQPDAEDSPWRPVAAASDSPPAESTYEFVGDYPETFLPLVVSAVDFNLPSATTVERVWLQTWLSGDVRQERAAFRFRTTGWQATVELPPQTPPGEIEVLVDGRPADVLSRGAGRIVVRLADHSAASRDGVGSDAVTHTLELRLRRPSGTAVLTRYRLTPPQIVGTTALSQVYWQIVLPGDLHVIQSPARMTSASQWQWLGSFWGHRPVMSQTELEEWSGASPQVAPAAGQNEYLYTGLAPAMSIELVTAPRWLVVLAASSAVLLMALTWVYVPFTRWTWNIVVAALLIAGLVVAFPTPAMLLAQASVLGVVVGILSLFLARLMARPTGRRATLSAGSTQRHLTPRPDSIVMPPVVATASTAPTVPLHVPDSER